jgi:hypothetical protein
VKWQDHDDGHFFLHWMPMAGTCVALPPGLRALSSSFAWAQEQLVFIYLTRFHTWLEDVFWGLSFHGFPQPNQAKSMATLWIRPLLLPSKFYQIHHFWSCNNLTLCNTGLL